MSVAGAHQPFFFYSVSLTFQHFFVFSAGPALPARPIQDKSELSKKPIDSQSISPSAGLPQPAFPKEKEDDAMRDFPKHLTSSRAGGGKCRPICLQGQGQNH